MFGIPSPPHPQWADLVAVGAAGACLVVGMVALLAGWKIARVLVCGLGVVAGLLLAAYFELDLTFRLVAAVVAGLLGLVLDRLVWALLMGAVCGGVAAGVLLDRAWGAMSSEGRPVFQAWDAGLGGWFGGVGGFAMDGLAALYGGQAVLLLVVVGPAVVLPVVLGLLRPRLARIVMTSLSAGAAVACGPIIAATQFVPGCWDRVLALWYVPAGLAAMLAVAGLAIQYRSAIRSDRSKQEREAEPPAEATGKAARG